jgi:hypothetical protein
VSHSVARDLRTAVLSGRVWKMDACNLATLA